MRRTRDGKRRDFALGLCPEVTLAQARERARTTLDKLWAGIDPAEERRSAGRAKAEPPSSCAIDQAELNASQAKPCRQSPSPTGAS